MSLRRTAEFLRSWLGRQERWRLSRPVATPPPGEACYLAASTVDRWIGPPARGVIQRAGQLQDIAQSAESGTDGL